MTLLDIFGLLALLVIIGFIYIKISMCNLTI